MARTQIATVGHGQLNARSFGIVEHRTFHTGHRARSAGFCPRHMNTLHILLLYMYKQPLDILYVYARTFIMHIQVPDDIDLCLHVSTPRCSLPCKCVLLCLTFTCSCNSHGRQPINPLTFQSDRTTPHPIEYGRYQAPEG